MSDMILFSTTMLEKIGNLFLSPPFSYLFGGILLLLVLKAFKALINR